MNGRCSCLTGRRRVTRPLDRALSRTRSSRVRTGEEVVRPGDPASGEVSAPRPSPLFEDLAAAAHRPHVMSSARRMRRSCGTAPNLHPHRHLHREDSVPGPVASATCSRPVRTFTTPGSSPGCGGGSPTPRAKGSRGTAPWSSRTTRTSSRTWSRDRLSSARKVLVTSAAVPEKRWAPSASAKAPPPAIRLAAADATKGRARKGESRM